MSSSFSSGSLVGGRYRIDREIGRGGMATVYLAWDKRHDRQVAVKVLSPGVTEGLGVDRFLAEIRTTAGLSHPNILPLLDSGHEGASPFFVMRYVPGESLRDRLEREGSLPIDQALRIGAAVAAALAHAHAEGVIHRDVKPGNILLDPGGNPYLADFGIARARSAVGDTRHTMTGQIIGTPQYMSPEQISGDRDLTGISDVYSLACVIYQMLCGEPPFKASSQRAIAAAHLTAEPRPLTAVPKALNELLLSALSKDPSDRLSLLADGPGGHLAGAAEFGECLDELRTTELVGRATRKAPFEGRARRRPLRVAGYALTAGLLAGAIAYGLRSALRPPNAGDTPLDTTRYAVLPFERDDTVRDMAPFEDLFEVALGEWDGITVVDELRVQDMIAERKTATASPLEAVREAARTLNAGRIVTGGVQRLGDSVQVEAVLRDGAASARPLETVVFVTAANPGRSDADVAKAVERLLFGPAPRVGTLLPQSKSVPGVRHFILGEQARDAWNLSDAADHFATAVRYDPFFDLAYLWRAQVMSWQGRVAREWEGDAQRAARSPRVLSVRDRALADALTAMADERHPEACQTYAELLESREDDFAALFGLGECRRRDERVVRDSESPTGWRFRGSAHAAANAYERAFERLPSSYRAFGSGDSDFAQRLLYARGSLRPGRGPPPESRIFVGFPEWHADSLVFVAVPNDSLLFVRSDPDAMAEALARQRRALLDVAHAWVRAFPMSGAAVNTLAVARELVGDASALPTYGEARALAEDPRLRASIGVSEAILQVRVSLPGDLDGVRAAVALGDSLLSSAAAAPPNTPERLADLAVLLGRPNAAARLRRVNANGEGLSNTPFEVNREGQALLAFAAVGAPIDSIASLEARTERLILEIVPQAERRQVRQNILEQPAFLAFPHFELGFLRDAGLPRARETRSIVAMRSGDTEEALSLLGDPFEQASWDVVLARANVLLAAGEGQRALSVLKHHFADLAVADPQEVAGMARLGGLIRAVLLRAKLEQTYGSHDTAVQWARAAEILWGTGESAVEEPLAETLAAVRSPDRP